MTKHVHDWVCYKEGSNMLVCGAPQCGIVTRLADLLDKSKKSSVERGMYDAYAGLVGKGMLTVRGQKAVNAFLRDHPITRAREVATATQVKLI